MTYSTQKPDPGPSPAIDYLQIQTNFSTYQTAFNENHTPLNNRNQGDHEDVILTLQANDPGVTEDLAVLYTKDATSAAGIQPQLFVQIPKFLPTKQDVTDAPNIGMQLTYNAVNTSGPIYQSFLPGGYLLYFGSVSAVNVPITISPTPTKILVAIATPNNISGGLPFTVSTTILSANSFQINSNASGVYTFGFVVLAVA